MHERTATTAAGRWTSAVVAHAAALALGVTIACADDVLKFTHQSIERTAILHQPAAAGAPRPLIIALPGLGQSPGQLRDLLRLDLVADREGFAVLYPEAIEKRWSYGRPVSQPMPTVGAETVDDIGFIRLLIEDLVSRKIADPARIYVTGMSRGGLMAFTLACVLAERIAAAVPIVTGMTDHQRDDCRPARPVPILVIAGTEDTTQAYDGWLLRTGRLLSVPETMEFWRTLHGCTRQEGKMLPHRDPADPTSVAQIDWLGCKSGGPLRLYRVQGGGHQLPSFTPSSEEGTRRWGRRNRDIETAEEIWAFVKNLSR